MLKYLELHSILRSSMVPSTHKLVILDRFVKDLKGSLTTLLILLIIDSEKEIYGYKIKKLLKRITFSENMITDSTLYTSLRSLESKYQLICSIAKKPRVYYSLTDKGKIELKNLLSFWVDTQKVTNQAIELLNDND